MGGHFFSWTQEDIQSGIFKKMFVPAPLDCIHSQFLIGMICSLIFTRFGNFHVSTGQVLK